MGLPYVLTSGQKSTASQKSVANMAAYGQLLEFSYSDGQDSFADFAV